MVFLAALRFGAAFFFVFFAAFFFGAALRFVAFFAPFFLVVFFFALRLVAFLGAVILGVLMRIQMLSPDSKFLNGTSYNAMFTIHGIIMIFFFLIPAIPAVLGNFLIPIMIGARDLAFPRLNLLSWYIFSLGGLLTLIAMIAGGVDTGWTPTTINWNNAPWPTQNLDRQWAGLGECLNYINCPSVTWDVSQLVADAYKAGLPLRFILYSADDQISSGKYFFSSDTGDWNARNRPTLQVTYGDP